MPCSGCSALHGVNSNLKKDKSFKETEKKKISKKNYEVESHFYITKNIAKEEFKIHESKIKELINFNINKNNEPLDKFFSEIVDLTASLEFMQKKLGTIPCKKKKYEI